MDIKSILSNIVRDGIVSSTDPSTMSARVTFPDRDNLVSYPLEVITHGSQDAKAYWMPNVGEQVLCLFLPNDDNLTQGYILGTTYNTKDTPAFNSQTLQGIKFPDGSTISYDSNGAGLVINCTGNLQINAPNGDVVVNGISLVNHTHGQVMPGGGNTGKPN